MFQKKTDELFSGMPNVLGIADDILIAGFDKQGKDNDEPLDKVFDVCRQTSLKLNKSKCLGWWSNFMTRYEPRCKKSSSAYIYATI